MSERHGALMKARPCLDGAGSRRPLIGAGWMTSGTAGEFGAQRRSTSQIREMGKVACPTLFICHLLGGLYLVSKRAAARNVFASQITP